MCTCGHDGPNDHNRFGACTRCPCPDFTSDDTVLADSVGVLAEGGAR